MNNILQTLLLGFSVLTNPHPKQTIKPNISTNYLKVDYHGFTLYMDCKEKMVNHFEYTIGKDTGNFPRENSFHFDNNVSKDCQQLNTKPYGSLYDLGHMVSSNQMDFSKESEYDSFSILNVLPQTKELNRGAWLQTERITECYRDTSTLKIYGGAILGNDRSKDYFLNDWGIKTPNYFWKIIIDEDSHKNIAWILPNTIEAKPFNLDSYIVSIDTINKLTGLNIKPLNSKTNSKEKTSWVLPKGCKAD